MSYPTPFQLKSQDKQTETPAHARKGKVLAKTFSKQNTNKKYHPFITALLTPATKRRSSKKNTSSFKSMKPFKPHFIGGHGSKLP